MRCGSAGTVTASGVTPAALRACRVGGPGSAAAASRPHDSSGRRSFPNTPAPAICVVGVISDRVDALLPEPPDPHPPQTTVLIMAAANAAASTGPGRRIPPNCTRPTLTSDDVEAIYDSL